MLHPPASGKLYGYAQVGRYGLGHSLLAWARCLLWCERQGARMLAPDWFHFRVGPLLRKERDRRSYHRLFQFGDYVNGFRRQWILRTAERTMATAFEWDDANPMVGDGLVVFQNLVSMNEETHFHEITGHSARVRVALTRMTRPEFRPAPLAEPHIAIHVRMGDFGSSVPLEKLRAGAKNARLPLSWFVSVLSGLREKLGNVPAIVYSDGDDAALAPLLNLAHVRRPPDAQSITDLLSMAQSRLIISSGSGFSMWGAYLGDSHRICFPGQRLVRVLGAPGVLDREPEVESAGELDAGFLRSVGRALSI
jgi:hypothetical protein